MALDHLAFDQITHTDLLRLIENGVAEDRMIDYKRDAIGTDDAAKKEFLKDVSALGNASGGNIVIGMEEDKSVLWGSDTDFRALSRSDDLDLQQPFLIEKSADDHRDRRFARAHDLIADGAVLDRVLAV